MIRFRKNGSEETSVACGLLTFITVISRKGTVGLLPKTQEMILCI